MAATQTVHQLLQSRNLLVPRHGVVTLFGYGIKVYVERGHLTLEDGIGIDRHTTCFPRVGHGLRRLVVIGSDGMVSLAALRWLADQDAAFVMLDRGGSALAVTGPVGPSDARLRRAQALARQSQVALDIALELIRQKLTGQQQLVLDKLNDPTVAQKIADARSVLDRARSIETLRLFEAQAAQAYWSAWRNLPVMFPRSDLKRVPDHWRVFGTRKSPLTGSPRLAVNPPNAMMNYLYALLESEARLAAVAVGLDPGLGFLHVDTDARDSLACDLMEAVRPQVDAYILDWIRREPLRREWFFEECNGNCRLMGSFCVCLCQTMHTWRRSVAPVAEWVSRTLWATVRNPARRIFPTNLTQNHRREAKGGAPLPIVAARPPRVCRHCGSAAQRGKDRCRACGVLMQRKKFAKLRETGRVASHTPEAEAKRAETQRKRFIAERKWGKSSQPTWLTEKFYVEEIQPRLGAIEIKLLSVQLGISIPYASHIRAGRRVPHPRHWQVLANLVGSSSNFQEQQCPSSP